MTECRVFKLPAVFSTPQLQVSKNTILRQEDVSKHPYPKGIQLPKINAPIGLLSQLQHFPMLALTVLGPSWFDAGGAKPTDMAWFSLVWTYVSSIEVVHSLDTDSFVNCMHRFIARRGQPEQIRSDNGGNFVRGEKELRNAIDRWNQEVIRKSSRSSSCREMCSGSSTPPSRLSPWWRVGALHSHHSKGDESPFKGAGPRRQNACHSHVRGGIHSQWQAPNKGVWWPQEILRPLHQINFFCYGLVLHCRQVFWARKTSIPTRDGDRFSIYQTFSGAGGSKSIFLVCKKGRSGQDQQLTSRLETSSLW